MAFEEWKKDEHGNIVLNALTAYDTGIAAHVGLFRLEYALDETRRDVLQFVVNPQQAVELLMACRMVAERLIEPMMEAKLKQDGEATDAALAAERGVITDYLDQTTVPPDPEAERLCQIWGEFAAQMVKDGMAQRKIAEVMLSTAVAGWIGVDGEREVARHLYLLSLQLTKRADLAEAQHQARKSTQH